MSLAPHGSSQHIRWPALFGEIAILEKVSIAGVLLITVIALAAPWLTPYDPNLRVGEGYQPPSGAFWFGTDEIGRDLFSRVLIGIRYTWLPALAVVLFSLALGSAIGLVSGTAGGKTDILIQRSIDLILVLPATLVALAVIASMGPGLANTMLAIAVVWWPWYARLCRDEVRRLAARPHVEAARLAGARGPRLMLRYLLPGVVPSLIVAATLDIANVVLTVSLLSFLGLGQAAPTPELGSMTARSLDSLTVFWWLSILPGAVVFLMCFCANLAGDGLRLTLRGR